MKKVFIVTGVLLAVLCAACAGVFYIKHNGLDKPEYYGTEREQHSFPDVKIIPDTAQPPGQSARQPTGETAQNEVAIESDPYISPIDFDALRKANPDIYAWLEIPGTEIDYPVVNRKGDNNFYLDHDSDGNYSSSGALFTEDYNNQEFSDPVTIIYGHNMKSGAMFGRLQEYYADQKIFKKNNVLNIYLSDKELTYKIFAAVPYGRLHILYYFNFSNKRIFDKFFRDIYSIRSLNAIFDNNISVGAGDNVVILSTCLKGDSNKRYLLMALLKSEKNND